MNKYFHVFSYIQVWDTPAICPASISSMCAQLDDVLAWADVIITVYRSARDKLMPTRASNEPSRRWTAGCDVAGGGGGHLSRPLGLEVGPLSQLYVIIMLWIVNMNHEMYYV